MNTKRILEITGVISIVGSFLYLLIVLLLGLVQPGYNHMIDTMSVLVLGQWGWVQNVNFFILAITVASFGIGLSVALKKKIFSLISLIFFALALSIIVIMVLPADAVDRTQVQLTALNSFHGFIHFMTTMIIVGLTIPLIITITRQMQKSTQFRHFTRYTLLSFTINIIAGILWFIFRRYGILFAWKGIWQKLMAVNVLAWMMVIGNQFLAESNKYARRTH